MNYWGKTMARKSFKEKEKAFLSKQNKEETTTTSASSYVPLKTQREKAYDLLKEKGFNVSYRNTVLYCDCKDAEEYEEYRAVLIKHFGKDDKVPFSYGASIGNPVHSVRAELNFREEKEEDEEKEETLYEDMGI